MAKLLRFTTPLASLPGKKVGTHISMDLVSEKFKNFVRLPDGNRETSFSVQGKGICGLKIHKIEDWLAMPCKFPATLICRLNVRESCLLRCDACSLVDGTSFSEQSAASNFKEEE